MRMGYYPDPLTKKAFINNLRINYSSGLLTLVSIVQGVIFATAAQVFFVYTSNNSIDEIVVIHLITSFLFITGMYYFYYYHISMFFIPPTMLLVSIIFLLGSSELAIVYTIGRPRLFIGMACFAFFSSIVAFSYTFVLINPARYADDFQGAYVLHRQEAIKNIICFVIMLFATIIIWLMYPKSLVHHYFYEYLFFILNGSIYAYVVWHSHVKFLSQLIRLAEESDA